MLFGAFFFLFKKKTLYLGGHYGLLSLDWKRAMRCTAGNVDRGPVILGGLSGVPGAGD